MYPTADPTGLMGPTQFQGLMGSPQGGPWSQLAYQMAGAPKQGGMYASVTPPASPTSATTPAGGGATAVGGTLLGLLGGLLNGGSGGSSGGSNIANSPLGKVLGGLLGNNFTPDPSIIGDAGAQTAADSASQLAAANTDAGDAAAASNQQWLDSLGGSAAGVGAGTGGGIAASSAAAGLGDAALAPVGVDAATATPAITGLGADAAAAGGSDAAATAGLGATAGSAAAVAGIALPIALGLMTPGFALNKSWWDRLQSNLNSSDPNTAAVARATLAQQAVTDPQAQALAAQYGIQALTPQLHGTVYGVTPGVNRNTMKL